MQVWIFYQSSDFYESFLQFNSKIKRKQSAQKAEQLIVVKYSSRVKGMPGALWTIIIANGDQACYTKDDGTDVNPLIIINTGA